MEALKELLLQLSIIFGTAFLVFAVLGIFIFVWNHLPEWGQGTLISIAIACVIGSIIYGLFFAQPDHIYEPGEDEIVTGPEYGPGAP